MPPMKTRTFGLPFYCLGSHDAFMRDLWHLGHAVTSTVLQFLQPFEILDTFEICPNGVFDVLQGYFLGLIGVHLCAALFLLFLPTKSVDNSLSPMAGATYLWDFGEK